MSTRPKLLAAVGMAALLSTVAAHAATSTASMLVTATVLSYCAVTANPLPFGNYSSTATSTANTTVGVLCTNGTPYNVGLNAGVGTGATVANRLMTNSGGTATLAYNLYTTSALSSVWGNTVGTNTVAGTGTGLSQTLNVYGQILSGQNVAAGLYTDTITVTLTY